MSGGTCCRNAKEETISAVSWVEGDDVLTQIIIVDRQGAAKSIVLPGYVALDFANDVKTTIANGKVNK